MSKLIIQKPVIIGIFGFLTILSNSHFLCFSDDSYNLNFTFISIRSRLTKISKNRKLIDQFSERSLFWKNNWFWFHSCFSLIKITVSLIQWFYKLQLFSLCTTFEFKNCPKSRIPECVNHIGYRLRNLCKKCLAASCSTCRCFKCVSETR